MSVSTERQPSFGVTSDIKHNRAETNGVRLHYITAGSGPIVLCLHGWPETHREYLYIIERLGHKYRFIAPDLRGFADSDKPFSGYEPKTIAADMLGLLDIEKVERFHILSHDLGGPAAVVPLRRPEGSMKKLVSYTLRASIIGCGFLTLEEKIMKHTRALAVLAFLAWLILPTGLAWGQANDEEKTVFEHVIPNVEGKSMVAVVVTYPPGGKSLAHHHAGSAFIYAYVLSGAIRSQVDDQPAKVYQVGEGFTEMPGSYHRISENASDSAPASLLAIFVVDSKDKPLTIPDKK